MSCYNWERGTIKIPTKEYSKLRKAVITEHNRLQDERFELALRCHAKVLAAKKGKRGFNAYHWANSADGIPWNVIHLMFSHDPKTNKWKFHKPKKKGLDKKPLTKDALLSLGGSAIIFKDRTVIWDVAENNRAVEDERAKPLAKFFFRKLDNITWTRGSGGKIVGNDEYNREADYEGGGGCYVTATYPPPPKPKNLGFRPYRSWR